MRELDRLPAHEALTEIIEVIGAELVFKATRLYFDWHRHSYASISVMHKHLNDLYDQLACGEPTQSELDARENDAFQGQRGWLKQKLEAT